MMGNICLVIFLGILYFCSGQKRIYMNINNYARHLGRNNITFQCVIIGSHIPGILMVKEHTPDNGVKDIAYMETKIGHWYPYQLNVTVVAEENYGVHLGYCISSYNCYMNLYFEMVLDKCSTINNYTMEYSCFQYSLDGREMKRSSKYSTQFRLDLDNSHHLDNVSVTNNRLGDSVTEGDVLRLSCQGDVTTTDGLSYTDIQWCSKYWSSLSLQDQPISEIITKSEDECNATSRSTIYYHITSADTNLFIKCQSSHFAPCYPFFLSQVASSSVTIKSKAKEERIIGQVFVYSEDDVIDPNKIVLTSYGKLLYLMCVASRQIENTNLNIRWCQKDSNGSWVNARLQNQPVIAANNVSNSRTEIYSRIAYHVTQEHDNITLLCELDNNSTCGTGPSSKNITLHVFTKDVTGTHMNTNTENMVMTFPTKNQESSSDSVLIAGIFLIVLSALIILVLGILIFLAIRRNKLPGLKVELTWNKEKDGRKKRGIGTIPTETNEGFIYENTEKDSQRNQDSKISVYDTLDVVDSPSHYEQLKSH